MKNILWGAPHSLYTGKLRSYLIKKGLPFEERFPSQPEFGTRILPAVGQFVVPVLETPEGEILQDTSDIIDLLEARYADPALDCTSGIQRLVSLLFDAFGSEYLLPLAMHYRWTYRAEQEEFLQAEFGRAVVPDSSRVERRAQAAKTMDFFNGFLPNLGVLPDAIPAMEASYLALIDALDEHFHYHPYLLGGRPSRGDFGMMAPLFAHLGRDPVPAGIMKVKAPNLFRWTERMNSPQRSDGEFYGYPAHYFSEDTIPATLEAVLKIAFADWTPGLVADVACFNAWAADKPAGTMVSLSGTRQIHPNVGPVKYPWRGVTIQRGSQPHMLWMFVAAQAHAASLEDEDARRLKLLLDQTEGTQALSLKLGRRMGRKDGVLVLLD